MRTQSFIEQIEEHTGNKKVSPHRQGVKIKQEENKHKKKKIQERAPTIEDKRQNIVTEHFVHRHPKSNANYKASCSCLAKVIWIHGRTNIMFVTFLDYDGTLPQQLQHYMNLSHALRNILA